jgi:hypothetical protein
MNIPAPFAIGIGCAMLLMAASLAYILLEARHAPCLDDPPTLEALTDCDWCADLDCDDNSACTCLIRCHGIGWCRGLIPAAETS